MRLLLDEGEKISVIVKWGYGDDGESWNATENGFFPGKQKTRRKAYTENKFGRCNDEGKPLREVSKFELSGMLIGKLGAQSFSQFR